MIAVDVGYGQLDWRLRQDSRVLVMERLNARDLGDSYLPFRPELITVDVSFISLAKLIAPIVATGADEFDLLGLVKPQFELGKEKVGKGGVGPRRRRPPRRNPPGGRGRAAGGPDRSAVSPRLGYRARRGTARPSSGPRASGRGRRLSMPALDEVEP